MPFGRKANPEQLKTYEFGCLAPIEGEEAALREMRKRVKLWNQLVELDHRYDEKKTGVMAEYVTTEDELERREQVKAAYQAEAVKEALKALDKEEYEEARALWLASDLYWVNHEEVKLAWRQAQMRRCSYRLACLKDEQERKKCPMVFTFRKCCKLRFHSWFHENGKLSVRWQTGLPVAEAFTGENTLLRLAPVSEAAYQSPIRGERRKAARSVVSIRVASDERKPVWLTLPCVLHRQLPPDGVIRSASVIWERIGTQFRWKLILVVSTPPVEKHPPTRGLLALKVCWRKREAGLRACYWQDDSGRSGEQVLSGEWVFKRNKVDDLQQIRKNNLNWLKGNIQAWFRENAVPDWLRERTRTIADWKSQGRMYSLCAYLRQNRFEGDEGLLYTLEAWRKDDRHLDAYQDNLLDQLNTQRREEYRLFAASIVKRYAQVLVYQVNLARLARNKVFDEAGHQRTVVAPSTLLQAIKNACMREGVAYTEIKPTEKRRCPSCGGPEDPNQEGDLNQKCLFCGSIYDGDRAVVADMLKTI